MPIETYKLVIVSFFLARITVLNVRTPSKVTCSINLLLIADIKKKIATKISNQKPNVAKKILGLLPVSENGKQRYEANILNIIALEKYNTFLGFIILNYLKRMTTNTTQETQNQTTKEENNAAPNIASRLFAHKHSGAKRAPRNPARKAAIKYLFIETFWFIKLIKYKRKATNTNGIENQIRASIASVLIILFLTNILAFYVNEKQQ